MKKKLEITRMPVKGYDLRKSFILAHPEWKGKPLSKELVAALVNHAESIITFQLRGFVNSLDEMKKELQK